MPTTSVLFALFGLFTTGSAMVTCAGSDPATKYCNAANGLIGMCNGSDTTCVTTKPCQTKNQDTACGDLGGSDAMLKGKCGSGGTNCEFTTKCATGDTNTKYCNASDNNIGKCNGATCEVTSQCTGKAKDAACGYVAGNVPNLKGVCADNAGNAATKCMFTAGSLPCAVADLSSKYCNDSNGYIGKCYGPTCQVATHCATQTKDAACGNVTVDGTPMLKGRCEADDGKCMFTTMCSTGDTDKKYCNDSDGYIGKCNGATCEADKPCAGKASNAACGYLTGGVAMLKGKCDTASTKKCMFTTMCATDDTSSKYCNDSDNNIGKCNSATCTVTGQCTSKAKDAACGYVAGNVPNLKGVCADNAGNAATKCMFTAGSLPCAVADPSSKYCNDSNSYIGQCFSEYCKIDNQCKGKLKNVACGGLLGSNSMLKGKCEADNKKCKYTKTVHVDYTVVADDAHKDDVHSKLQTATFKGELQLSLTRTVVESGLFCPNVAVPSIPNGMLTCPPFTRDACTLSCQTTGYSVQHPAQRKCLETGIWQGAVGKCESSCLQPTGFTKNSDNKYEKGVTNGKVVCDNFFKGTTCQLVCTNPATQYANPDTTYKCEEVDGANTWTGVMGSCTETNEFSASAEIHLNPADDYEDIIAKSNGQFNNEFKAAVAAHLDGVLARNVMIVNIRASGGGGSRRLNERSVLVDYTVAYAKPLEGGLRGIR